MLFFSKSKIYFTPIYKFVDDKRHIEAWQIVVIVVICIVLIVLIIAGINYYRRRTKGYENIEKIN